METSLTLNGRAYTVIGNEDMAKRPHVAALGWVSIQYIKGKRGATGILSTHRNGSRSIQWMRGSHPIEPVTW